MENEKKYVPKFLFIFSNGVTLTIPAETKIKAIEVVASKFERLFEKESVTVSMLSHELNSKGQIIAE